MSLAIRKIRLNQRGRSMSQTAERMRRATPKPAPLAGTPFVLALRS
jgi:hypothetical protein